MRRFTSKEVLTFKSSSSNLDELHTLQYKHSLLALLELSHDLSFKNDVYSIAETAVLNFMGHVGTTRVALWMFSEDSTRRLILLRSQGLRKNVAEAMGGVVATDLLEAIERQPYPLNGDELDRLLSESGAAIMRDTQMVLVAPLITRGSLLGILALGKPRGGDGYSASVIEILRASLNIVATALDNSWRHSRMLETNRQLRAANDELQSLDRLKSDFLSTLDHEFKTPLTLMGTYLHAFKDSGSWNDHQEQWLRILGEQVDRLEQLIMTLLDWKSLDEPENNVEVSIDRLDDVARDFYTERKPGVTAKLRNLSLKVDPNLPPAAFNRERVVQLLDVLLDNAEKFTPQGSHIVLRLQLNGSRVELCVSDDGPGIPADRLGTIFESFRQVEPVLTRTHGGVGIGLAVARKLAECMGGELTAESEVGKGTTMMFSLEAVEQRRAA